MFQLNRLEEEFQKDMYAGGMKRMRLAGELNLSEKQVKVWFQNRRMKYKRICQRLHNRRMAGNKFWQWRCCIKWQLVRRHETNSCYVMIICKYY